MVARTETLRTFFRAIERSSYPDGTLPFAIAALALGMVSVFTFRPVEGFVFSFSTMAACALVYALGSVSKKWS